MFKRRLGFQEQRDTAPELTRRRFRRGIRGYPELGTLREVPFAESRTDGRIKMRGADLRFN
ncbi:MAG: hypothetical protein ACYDC5_00145 [Candidatus Dormibacteria bacterium]